MMMNLSDIEKKAFTDMHQDGLFELFFGNMLLAGMVRDAVPFWGGPVRLAQLLSLGVIAWAVLVYTLGKKRMTVPRLGYVKFSQARRSRIARLRWLLSPLALVSVASVLAFLLARGSQAAAGGGPAPWGPSIGITLLIFGCISAVAYYLDYPRLYAVAALVALTEPAHMLVKHYTEIRPVGLVVKALPTFILILWGFILQMNFVKRYPLRNLEADHEG